MTCRENVRRAILFLIDCREGGSPRQFGDKIGRFRQRVNAWCRGESAPDLETVGDIALAYGVSLDWLITGNEDKAPEGYVEYAFVHFGQEDEEE